MFKTIKIERKGPRIGILISAAINLGMALFFYFDEDSALYWSYPFILVAFINMYAYFTENKLKNHE